jgi:hypothetical protein
MWSICGRAFAFFALFAVIAPSLVFCNMKETEFITTKNEQQIVMKEENSRLLLTSESQNASALHLHGCEAYPVTLTCPLGQVIATATIKYGRWNNAVCPHWTVRASTPSRFRNYTLSHALGQSSYSMIAENFDVDINEDVHPGVYKHWKISYHCAPPPSIHGCEGRPATLTCAQGEVITTATIRYGRWNNVVCPHWTVRTLTPRRFKDYKLSHAIGQSSYSMVADGLHVDINDDFYPGVYKHWEISFTCAPPPLIRGCGSKPAKLTCPEGQVITAVTIKYGRWNNEVCPHWTVSASTPSRFRNYTLSHAIGQTSYSMIAESLDVDINDDPFPGVYKHWEVSYRCSPPSSIRGCEGRPATLTCPQGQVIKAATIQYGRWNNNVCPHRSVRASTPRRFREYTLSHAIGQNSHSMVADGLHVDINDDFHPGVYKHWEISFTCAPPPLIRGCGSNPATLTCPQGQVITAATIKYGRWNNAVCPHLTVRASTPSTFKDYTLFHAIGKNSYSMVVESSDVDINEDTFPGVFKHWEISYRCAPPPSIRGCEADPVTLTCPQGQVIAAATIKYGRWSKVVCPHRSVGALTQSRFKDYTLFRAIGQSSYSLGEKESDVDINEDIYPGVYKHWKITYNCVPKQSIYT